MGADHCSRVHRVNRSADRRLNLLPGTISRYYVNGVVRCDTPANESGSEFSIGVKGTASCVRDPQIEVVLIS